MNEFIGESKSSISMFLKGYLEEMAARFSFMRPLGPDAISRLEAFSQGGKMIRGALALLGHRLYGGKRPVEALRCAAAMELFQAGFLIHDDIMDRDRTRRGLPSFYWQYAKRAEEDGLSDPYHAGEALGTCGGDVAFFLGFQLLSMDASPPGFLAFCSRELSIVGLAQMQDVFWGASSALPGNDEIINLYTHKTGRYSFSMPLIAGAMLAGRKEAECQDISRLGELMGIVFQIRDDELGLFGDEAELGKPIGSDMREGKKTIFYRALVDSLDPADRMRIGAYFGSADSGDKELAEVRSLLKSRGGRATVLAIAERARAEAERILAGLEGADRDGRAILSELLAYVSERAR